jgi:hypothetical protein
MAAAIASTLRERCISDPAASLTLEAGITVFKIAFGHSLQENTRELPELIGSRWTSSSS